MGGIKCNTHTHAARKHLPLIVWERVLRINVHILSVIKAKGRVKCGLYADHDDVLYVKQINLTTTTLYDEYKEFIWYKLRG